MLNYCSLSLIVFEKLEINKLKIKDLYECLILRNLILNHEICAHSSLI